MILIDSGPLVAMCLVKDRNRQRCVSAVEDLEVPLVTTVACMTEAMHIIGRVDGWRGQSALWRLMETGLFIVEGQGTAELSRVAELMESYRDVPCDFGDATLLALGERVQASKIITLDGHFYAYRVLGRSIDVVPGPAPS